ncbi:MAG: Site-specific recombinase, partial [Massilia sp.]|nr:Site-specific recombinase [Massilia sp.]
MAKARGVVLGNPQLRVGTPDQARAAAAVKQQMSRARAVPARRRCASSPRRSSRVVCRRRPVADLAPMQVKRVVDAGRC